VSSPRALKIIGPGLVGTQSPKYLEMAQGHIFLSDSLSPTRIRVGDRLKGKRHVGFSLKDIHLLICCRVVPTCQLWSY
jgi:hypothetical protein